MKLFLMKTWELDRSEPEPNWPTFLSVHVRNNRTESAARSDWQTDPPTAESEPLGQIGSNMLGQPQTIREGQSSTRSHPSTIRPHRVQIRLERTETSWWKTSRSDRRSVWFWEPEPAEKSERESGTDPDAAAASHRHPLIVIRQLWRAKRHDQKRAGSEKPSGPDPEKPHTAGRTGFSLKRFRKQRKRKQTVWSREERENLSLSSCRRKRSEEEERGRGDSVKSETWSY